MSKAQESSTDKNAIDLGSDFSGGIMDKKPNWVNLTNLDGPMDDSLANRLLYKVWHFIYFFFTIENIDSKFYALFH